MALDSYRVLAQDASGSPIIATGAAIQLLPGTVLVKVCAVGLNPSDYKTGPAFPAPGAVIGMDFAGSVVDIAPGTRTTFQPGDRVCGVVYGSNSLAPDVGAFAEYVRADVDFLLRVPPSTDPDNQRLARAASLGVALATSALALWGPDGLNLTATPDAPAPVSSAEGEASQTVLVYGGSTCCGATAIQLLKLSGVNPIAACSPPNFDLARSRGASAVFDRAGAAADVAGSVRAHTRGRLRHALDCVGDGDSARACYDALSRVGGAYAALNRVPGALLDRRRAVRAAFFHAAEGLGAEVRLPGYLERPASAAKRDLVAGCFRMYQRLWDAGKLQPHPTRVLETRGLEGVLEGLVILKSGGISGEKLVVLMP
ncbi:hypothetical protein Hte_006018 [Hypoxylon texense]